jgi:hypothetical protein
MGAQRTSFSKLQRDRDKKAKAAAKRERRQERSAASNEPEATDTLVADGTGELSADELLKAIESIHRRFEAKTISYEEFEEQKAELLSRLPVD